MLDFLHYFFLVFAGAFAFYFARGIVRYWRMKKLSTLLARDVFEYVAKDLSAATPAQIVSMSAASKVIIAHILSQWNTALTQMRDDVLSSIILKNRLQIELFAAVPVHYDSKEAHDAVADLRHLAEDALEPRFHVIDYSDKSNVHISGLVDPSLDVTVFDGMPSEEVVSRWGAGTKYAKETMGLCLTQDEAWRHTRHQIGHGIDFTFFRFTYTLIPKVTIQTKP